MRQFLECGTDVSGTGAHGATANQYYEKAQCKIHWQVYNLCVQSARRSHFGCQPRNRAHDVTNLWIPDGASFSSATKKTTLTVIALAMRAAQNIAETLRRGEV